MKDWQTLIGSTFALVAAAIAYRSATDQLKQNDRHERLRRTRKHAAIRSMLPLALAEASDFALQSAHRINLLVTQCNKESLPENTAPDDLISAPPAETISLLADFIEYSENIDVGVMESAVAWIQVHYSRVTGIVRDNRDPRRETIVLRTNLEESILDAASIYAAMNGYFDYARRRKNEPAKHIDWNAVRTVLKNMKFWEDEYPRLYEIINRRERTTLGPFDRLER